MSEPATLDVNFEAEAARHKRRLRARMLWSLLFIVIAQAVIFTINFGTAIPSGFTIPGSNWTEVWRGWGALRINGIVAGNRSNILITGIRSKIADVDPGWGIKLRKAGGPSVDNGKSPEFGFIGSMSPSGIIQWLADAPGTNLSIDVNKSGNIFVGGKYNQTLDFDPGSGIDSHRYTQSGLSPYSEDSYLAAYTGNGDFRWAETWPGIVDYIRGPYVKADTVSDSVYIAGLFGGSEDFAPGSPVWVETSRGQTDVFLCKVDSQGALVWVKTFGGTRNDTCTGIDIDSHGNVYMIGTYSWPGIDPSDSSGSSKPSSWRKDGNYLVKFDPSGKYLWSKFWEDGSACYAELHGVATGGSDEVVVTGSIASAMYDPTGSLPGSAYLARFSGDGKYEWGISWKEGTVCQGLAVTFVENGYSFVTGSVKAGDGSSQSFVCKASPDGRLSAFESADNSVGNAIIRLGSEIIVKGTFGKNASFLSAMR